jgi:hypothetical protein
MTACVQLLCTREQACGKSTTCSANGVLGYAYRGFKRKGDRVLGYNIIVVAKRY